MLSKDVNLDTHIADVVNLIKWESLDNVCLVAWSYAGFVGAAPSKVSAIESPQSCGLMPFYLPTDKGWRTVSREPFCQSGTGGR